ncbi:V-set domain-containing T-cell activation inhibitor 1-like isoform 2-T2 [Menidia menidia]
MTHPVRVLVWLLGVYLSSVSCQPTEVRGSVGGNATLPCVSDLQKVDVFWRDKGGDTVLDIIKGKEDLKSQDQRYRSRVSSFPDQIQKGNFSIFMRNLTQEDTGSYECKIRPGVVDQEVLLNVSVEAVKAVTQTSEAGRAATGGSPSGGAGPPRLQVALLVPGVWTCVFILFQSSF